MKATKEQISELSNAIALQAGVLGRATLADDLNRLEIYARALLLQDNIDTLVAWTKD